MPPAWLIVLGAAGATYVLTHGKIAAPFRHIYPPLLCCPMCAGFWVGLLVGVVRSVVSEAGLQAPHLQAFTWVLFAFATSLVASAFSIALVTIGSYAKHHGYAPGDACERMIERLRREHAKRDNDV